jgi:hypothetical protein
MNKIRILAFLLYIGAFVLAAIPVSADTANPDSAPTITTMAVYRELAEPGDILYIWESNIPYAVPPSTKESETFIWRLIDTDGTTVLGTATGYSFNDDGYGYNVYSMYFPAADVTSLGVTWGTAYTLRLSGNPTVFVTPPEYNYTVLAAYYTSETAHAENQEALAAKILDLAFDLNSRWGLTGSNILTLEMETGTVLSLIGEDFFRGAVRGLQTMAPAAFRFILADLNVPDRSWNDSYATALENQYAGSWIEAAKNSSRDFLGTSYDLMSIIIVLALCVALVFINLSLTSDHWNALIDVSFLLVIGARLGAYSFLYLGLVCAIALIFIGTKIYKMIPGT